MDPAKTSIIISIVSAAGTVAAAIIYWWTLNELRRQRANTYRPHLFIDNTTFFVTPMRRGDIMMPTKWEEEPRHEQIEEFKGHDFLRNQFSLKCYNIGFGTATKVNVKFSYAIDEFIDRIKALEQEIPQELGVTITSKGMFITFEPKHEKLPYSGIGINKDSELERYIGYILPAHISNASTTIQLPHHFLELLNIYIFYVSSLMGRKKIETNIPIVTVEIDYTDIANVNTLKTLTISTELGMFGVMGYAGKFVILEGE